MSTRNEYEPVFWNLWKALQERFPDICAKTESCSTYVSFPSEAPFELTFWLVPGMAEGHLIFEENTLNFSINIPSHRRIGGHHTDIETAAAKEMAEMALDLVISYYVAFGVFRAMPTEEQVEKASKVMRLQNRQLTFDIEEAPSRWAWTNSGNWHWTEDRAPRDGEFVYVIDDRQNRVSIARVRRNDRYSSNPGAFFALDDCGAARFHHGELLVPFRVGQITAPTGTVMARTKATDRLVQGLTSVAYLFDQEVDRHEVTVRDMGKLMKEATKRSY